MVCGQGTWGTCWAALEDGRPTLPTSRHFIGLEWIHHCLFRRAKHARIRSILGRAWAFRDKQCDPLAGWLSCFFPHQTTTRSVVGSGTKGGAGDAVT
jgi:hypothetical protein